MKISFKYLLVLSALTLLNSCIVVKYQGSGEDDGYMQLELSPKPEIPMSDELVKSPKGDMIAFLPEEWFFVDVESEASSNIFAVAVNPDYTLSAVFSEIAANESSEGIIHKEGLLGLARQSFLNHEKKSAGIAKQNGSFTKINIGTYNFGSYEMTGNNSDLRVKAAVFISSTGQYYQIALIPMQIKHKPVPSDAEIDKIFRSILTTVKY